MSVKIEIFRNDLKPDLQMRIARAGVPVNLILAEKVTFIGVFRPQGGDADEPLFERDATTVDGVGLATMEWELGDTAREGIIKVEVEVVHPGGKPETFRPENEDGEQVVFKVVPDYGGN